MRVMPVANIDPGNRFANGATGRLLSWEPYASHGRKPIPASDDRVCARFCHEGSVAQRVRLPNVDWVDVTPRMESAPHEATMVQLPIGPAGICSDPHHLCHQGIGPVLLEGQLP